MEKGTAIVEQLDTVVHPHSRRCCGPHEMTAIRCPVTNDAALHADSAQKFFARLVPEIHVAEQVPEAADAQESSEWIPPDSVPHTLAEVDSLQTFPAIIHAY